MGDCSLSIHEHATLQSLHSSFLHATRDTVHMTGEDISNSLRSPVATPSMMPLDDEPWHGLVPPSSWTALGLSTSPSQGTPSWFAGQSAAALLEQISACPKREMSLSPWKLVHGHQQLFQLYAKAIAATATIITKDGC